MPTEKQQPRLLGQGDDGALGQTLTLWGQQNADRISLPLSLGVLDGLEDGGTRKDHAGAAPKGSVVYRSVPIAGKVANR